MDIDKLKRLLAEGNPDKQLDNIIESLSDRHDLRAKIKADEAMKSKAKIAEVLTQTGTKDIETINKTNPVAGIEIMKDNFEAEATENKSKLYKSLANQARKEEMKNKNRDPLSGVSEGVENMELKNLSSIKFGSKVESTPELNEEIKNKDNKEDSLMNKEQKAIFEQSMEDIFKILKEEDEEMTEEEVMVGEVPAVESPEVELPVEEEVVSEVQPEDDQIDADEPVLEPKVQANDADVALSDEVTPEEVMELQPEMEEVPVVAEVTPEEIVELQPEMGEVPVVTEVTPEEVMELQPEMETETAEISVKSQPEVFIDNNSIKIEIPISNKEILTKEFSAEEEEALQEALRTVYRSFLNSSISESEELSKVPENAEAEIKIENKKLIVEMFLENPSDEITQHQADLLEEAVSVIAYLLKEDMEVEEEDMEVEEEDMEVEEEDSEEILDEEFEEENFSSGATLEKEGDKLVIEIPLNQKIEDLSKFQEEVIVESVKNILSILSSNLNESFEDKEVDVKIQESFLKIEIPKLDSEKEILTLKEALEIENNLDAISYTLPTNYAQIYAIALLEALGKEKLQKILIEEFEIEEQNEELQENINHLSYFLNKQNLTETPAAARAAMLAAQSPTFLQSLGGVAGDVANFAVANPFLVGGALTGAGLLGRYLIKKGGGKDEKGRPGFRSILAIQRGLGLGKRGQAWKKVVKDDKDLMSKAKQNYYSQQKDLLNTKAANDLKFVDPVERAKYAQEIENKYKSGKENLSKEIQDLIKWNSYSGNNVPSRSDADYNNYRELKLKFGRGNTAADLTNMYDLRRIPRVGTVEYNKHVDTLYDSSDDNPLKGQRFVDDSAKKLYYDDLWQKEKEKQEKELEDKVKDSEDSFNNVTGELSSPERNQLNIDRAKIVGKLKEAINFKFDFEDNFNFLSESLLSFDQKLELVSSVANSFFLSSLKGSILESGYSLSEKGLSLFLESKGVDLEQKEKGDVLESLNSESTKKHFEKYYQSKRHLDIESGEITNKDMETGMNANDLKPVLVESELGNAAAKPVHTEEKPEEHTPEIENSDVYPADEHEQAEEVEEVIVESEDAEKPYVEELNHSGSDTIDSDGQLAKNEEVSEDKVEDVVKAEPEDVTETVQYRSLKEAFLLEADYFEKDSAAVISADDKKSKLTNQLGLLVARDVQDPLYEELLKTTAYAKQLQEELQSKYKAVALKKAGQLLESKKSK